MQQTPRSCRNLCETMIECRCVVIVSTLLLRTGACRDCILARRPDMLQLDPVFPAIPHDAKQLNPLVGPFYAEH